MSNSGRLDKYNLGRVKTLGKRKVAALRAKVLLRFNLTV